MITTRHRPGKRGISLNTRLIAKQGLDQKRVNIILRLHEWLDDMLKRAETQTVADRRALVLKVRFIECMMQKAWGFSVDENFHTHWMRIPGCTCPRMDNTDIAYYGRGRIISGDCPIHGMIVKST
jgi:hypothetical protein